MVIYNKLLSRVQINVHGAKAEIPSCMRQLPILYLYFVFKRMFQKICNELSFPKLDLGTEKS
jgi:hypothetical protein